jgi:hypothetical protein
MVAKRILKIKSDKFGIYRICRTPFTYQKVHKNKIKHEIVIPVFLFRHFLRQYRHTRCHSSLLFLSISTSGMNPVFDTVQVTQLKRA